MPSSQVDVRCRHSTEKEVAIIEAVHAALLSAFRIPLEDKHVRLVVHEPHRSTYSPSLAHPELYTQVTVDCFLGRSVEAKRKLYSDIVDRFEGLGIPRDHVTILVRDSGTENWGIRGGQAACDVDLGFDVNI